MAEAAPVAPSAPAAPPPPAAPPAAAQPPAQAREVAVDPNPVRAPTPVGSQAPPAREPQGTQARATDRREAIANAYRKVEHRQTPAAQAKIGHNQPPEAIDSTPPKRPQQQQGGGASPSAFDLKKPPPKERQRGEGGRFAPNQPQPGQQRAQQQAPQLPQNAPYREAPARMHERARAEWSAAPESVRGEVHRMHNDFSRAYQQLKASHDYATAVAEAFEPIRHYHDLAQSQGTTLLRALDNYSGMERKIRSDILGALDVIVYNANLRTDDNRQITFRDLCHYVATQSPEQLQARHHNNVQTAHNMQLSQIQQQLAAVADNQQRMQAANQYAQQYFHTRREVDRFAATHPRVDELGDVIAAEMTAGHDIETAYRRATLLRPTPAAQPRTPPAQTRMQTRSINGAPDGGTPSGRQPRRHGQPPPPLRDTIARAVQRVRGL